MPKFHESLDFLGDVYTEYDNAVSEYNNLREELFGELRNTVRRLIEQDRNNDGSVLMPLGKMMTKAGHIMDFSSSHSDWKFVQSKEIEVDGILSDDSGMLKI